MAAPQVRTQRFPLVVGTRSYRTIATVPSLVLFGASMTLTLVVAAPQVPSDAFNVVVRVLWIITLLMCVSPVAILAQLGFVIERVVEAASERACDLELGGGKVRVIGGPSHGFEATLEALSAPGAIELGERALTLKSGKRELSVSVPRDADERASIEALCASLRAATLGDARAHLERPKAATRTAVFVCGGCGAPLTPTLERAVRCRFCGMETQTPDDIMRKVADGALVEKRRRADEALSVALRNQPGPRIANVVAFGGGALVVVLAAGSVLFSALIGFVMDETAFVAKWRGAGLVASGVALCLIAYVRARLGSRTALRVLTLGFSAVPPSSAGAPTLCRQCGGALPEYGVDKVLVRCVYCDAENLTAVDLGFDADVVKRFSAGELSPAGALAVIRRRRLSSWVLSALGLLFMIAGVAWRLDWFRL